VRGKATKSASTPYFTTARKSKIANQKSKMQATAAEDQRYAELQLIALDFARHGEAEQLARMLRHLLPVNLEDAKGNTLLMLACYHGNLETARLLLDYGADVDRPNDRGQTPLGGVAFKGYTEIVALLLDNGANIDADNGIGMTPLMFAAMFGRAKVVEQLTARGASLKQRNRLGLTAGLMVRLSRLFARLLGKTAPSTLSTL
jgi:ankyrin repeat protein